MNEEYNRGRRRDLVGYAMDLVDLANNIAGLAEREVAPYVGPPIARQVEELLEARKIRERMFHLNRTHPGWTFLLSLYRAHLGGESVELEIPPRHVHFDALCRVAMVTVEEGESPPHALRRTADGAAVQGGEARAPIARLNDFRMLHFGPQKGRIVRGFKVRILSSSKAWTKCGPRLCRRRSVRA